MQTTANSSLHWLTATLGFPAGIDIKTRIAFLADFLEPWAKPEQSYPYPKNYTRGEKLTYGRLSYHPDRPDMKICYNLTGTDLETMYDDNPQHIPALFNSLHMLGATYTRIDLALDWPEKVDLSEIEKTIKGNPSCTKAKTFSPYRKIDIGEAVTDMTTGIYIGSTRSDRWLCVYDKALELDLPYELLTRIEARNRKAKAQQAADAIRLSGLPETTRAIIQDFASLPLDWWISALSGDITELAPIGRKKTNTVKWLLETVAPVLDRELRANGGMTSELYQRFAKIIIDHTGIDLAG